MGDSALSLGERVKCFGLTSAPGSPAVKTVRMHGMNTNLGIAN